MPRRAAALLFLLAAGCGTSGPLPDQDDPVAAATDLQPCTIGRTWRYRVRIDGGVHTPTQSLLANEERHFPEWNRTLATPNLYVSHDGGLTFLDKGLLPVVDGVLHVAREAWFPGTWSLIPPMPLFGGAEARVGATWEWSGRLELQRDGGWYAGSSAATGTVEAWEWIEVPAGRFPCLRTRVVHTAPLLEIVRWHATGVGLVKETASEGGKVFLEAELTGWTR